MSRYFSTSKPSHILKEYSLQRRSIGVQNTQLSIRNYKRTLKLLECLHLNPDYPAYLTSFLNTLPISKQTSKLLFEKCYKISLKPLEILKYNNLASFKIIDSMRKVLRESGLPLVFPRYELFNYKNRLKVDDDTKGLIPGLNVGYLLPYIKCELLNHDKNELLTLNDIESQITKRWLVPEEPHFCILCMTKSIVLLEKVKKLQNIVNREGYLIVDILELYGDFNYGTKRLHESDNKIIYINQWEENKRMLKIKSENNTENHVIVLVNPNGHVGNMVVIPVKAGDKYLKIDNIMEYLRLYI